MFEFESLMKLNLKNNISIQVGKSLTIRSENVSVRAEKSDKIKLRKMIKFMHQKSYETELKKYLNSSSHVWYSQIRKYLNSSSKFWQTQVDKIEWSQANLKNQIKSENAWVRSAKWDENKLRK